MQVLTNWLGTVSQIKGFGWVDPNLVLGVLLVVFVLLVPRGLTGLATDAWNWLKGLKGLAGRAPAESAAAREQTDP
jgi:Sec-independent protein translocase protein TatA